MSFKKCNNLEQMTEYSRIKIKVYLAQFSAMGDVRNPINVGQVIWDWQQQKAMYPLYLKDMRGT